MTNLKCPSAVASSNISGNSTNLRHPLKWVSWLIVIYKNHQTGERSHSVPQTLKTYFCNGLAWGPNRLLACSCGEIDIAMFSQKYFFTSRLPLTPIYASQACISLPLSQQYARGEIEIFMSPKILFFTRRLPLTPKSPQYARGQIKIAMSPKTKLFFQGPLTTDQRLAFYFRNLEHFFFIQM